MGKCVPLKRKERRLPVAKESATQLTKNKPEHAALRTQLAKVLSTQQTSDQPAAAEGNSVGSAANRQPARRAANRERESNLISWVFIIGDSNQCVWQSIAAVALGNHNVHCREKYKINNDRKIILYLQA